MERIVIGVMVIAVLLSIATIVSRIQRKNPSLEIKNAGGGLELIYVYAPTCGRCPAQKDVVDAIMRDHSGDGRLVLTAINAQKDRNKLSGLNIMTVPSVLLRAHDGQVVFSRSGYVSQKQLQDVLALVWGGNEKRRLLNEPPF